MAMVVYTSLELVVLGSMLGMLLMKRQREQIAAQERLLIPVRS